MEWKAQWIWAQEGIGSKNVYLCFRRNFNVPGRVAQASAYCTADGMYKLYINGRYVGRGPARCDQFRRSYDRYNLTPLLAKGKNEVLAFVHYPGEDMYDGVRVTGGFLFQLEGNTMTGRKFSLFSDRSWEVGRMKAWDRRSFRMGPGLGFCEEYDARREEVDWRRVAVLAPAEAGPWGSLEPRGIPLLMEEFMPAERVVVVGRCKPPEGRSFGFDLGERFGKRDAVAYLSTYLWSEGSQEVGLSLGSSGGVRVWVDGEEVLSYHMHGRAEPGQHRVRLTLDGGWHELLLKSDHSAGEWKVYLDLEGDVGVSAVRDLGCGPSWMAIGPFENEMVGDECVGFSSIYPPEEGLDFGSACPGKGGDVEWVPWDSAAERMSAEEIEPSEFHEGEMVIPAGRPTAVVLDLGREVVGYPRISLDAPEGTVVDLGYGDELEGGRLIPAGRHYADRYICREGMQEWETFGRRAFRYIQLTFRRATRPVRLREVGVNLVGYPVRELGSFSCSDELLNRIWEVGRYTVKLCMYDAYESDPLTRIQRMEDARAEALVNYYAFGDYKLISRTLRQFARSQGEDGMLREAHPSGVPFPSSPRASAIWAISLWEYVLYSGDLELAGELFPCLERALEGMKRYGEDGLLDDAETNMFYAGALGAASRTARLLGDEAGYAKYLGRFKALAKLAKVHPRDECGLADFLAVCFGIREEAESPPEGSSCPPHRLSYVAEALLKLGREEALDVLRGWGKMLEGGATTWREGGARCYGASSGPTYLLSAYILGVVPLEPGWRRFRVMPRPCGLEWAEGKIPTPFGRVSASWRSEGGMFRLSLEAPPECVVEVGLPGRGELLRNGSSVRAKEEGGYLWCELRPEGREELEVSGRG